MPEKQQSLPLRARNLTKDSALYQCLGPVLISLDTPVAFWHNEQEVCSASSRSNATQNEGKAIPVTGHEGP
jgi:hypothetical protein